MEASIITTYRCINKCHMCHTWKFPTKEEEEFAPSLLRKLPSLSFCNVTGGEPFMRHDIAEITRILLRKSKRLVISTNGYFTDRIIDLAKTDKRIGIRISIEGLPAANDELRGIKDGFDHGLRTLLELKRLGLKDIGFGITVSDRNAKDMLELYYLAKYLKVEFATAVVHNSYYFHKSDNKIVNTEEVIHSFKELIQELLRTWRIKNWYRAYFNHGLINVIQGYPRLLPCRAGTDLFFLDPWGEIRPCNGMEEGIWYDSLGNLHQYTFDEIWNSERAQKIRKKVADCPKSCWMIGTASPAMKKNLLKPTLWVLNNKFRTLRNTGQ
ncbi:MAG: radical SAM protein [Candidatus Aminicenantes bacterium]|jgi:MoaA/NifB/PqqE/SkfB family radical SAM enzyme